MLRLQFPGACYHLINRGNYRGAIFANDTTKRAFVQCLFETVVRTGWLLHAWCLLSNHYHLAAETPAPNLVAGMQWLQGTFATRFNRFRDERGHLFQGRYKSIVVELGKALGGVCHYVHLNPVRAGILPVEKLGEWKWGSIAWLLDPRRRPSWYSPHAALASAGELGDTPKGRQGYLEFLKWLSTDDAEQRRLGFDTMSRGWAIGSDGFKESLLADERNRELAAASAEGACHETRVLAWKNQLGALISCLAPAERFDSRKFAPWKVAVAAVMRERTTAPNRWLSEQLKMGSASTVSRTTNECRRGGPGHLHYRALTSTGES